MLDPGELAHGRAQPHVVVGAEVRPFQTEGRQVLVEVHAVVEFLEPRPKVHGRGIVDHSEVRGIFYAKFIVMLVVDPAGVVDRIHGEFGHPFPVLAMGLEIGNVAANGVVLPVNAEISLILRPVRVSNGRFDVGGIHVPFDVLPGFGDDIDYAVQGARPVEGGAGAHEDLDPLDLVGQERIAEKRRAGGHDVGLPPVDQEEHRAAVQIAVEAAQADHFKAVGVGLVHVGNGPQRLRDAPPAVPFNFLVGDDVHRSGGCQLGFLGFGGRHDRGDFAEHDVFHVGTP